MYRFIKLISLLLISMSVYWIYQKTMNSYYQITSIGDQYSLGITSYGIKEYSYIDYMQEEIQKTKDKVETNKTYNQKDQSIKNVLFLLKQTPEIKKTLYDTNLLVLSLGYNDVISSMIIEDNKESMNEIKDNYNQLIKEIRKYYHKDIIILGYIEDDRYDSNQQVRIKKLNNILKSNKEIIYIDTNQILKERSKYYLNSKNHYPNSLGYKRIADKIIQKTLENKENI